MILSQPIDKPKFYDIMISCRYSYFLVLCNMCICEIIRLESKIK